MESLETHLSAQEMIVKTAFKPRLESLEDRLVLDGYAGTHVLYQDVVVPIVVQGRVTGAAVDPAGASGNTCYIGSSNGGVWKTTDGGNSWLPGTSQPGAHDIGTDSRPGSGILKSTDAGTDGRAD